MLLVLTERELLSTRSLHRFATSAMELARPSDKRYCGVLYYLEPSSLLAHGSTLIHRPRISSLPTSTV
jgi:hypothetical protein